MNRFHQSLVLSAADRYGSLVLLLGSMAILSRLLTPQEFGVYSIISALMALATTLREFGGANYLIQKPALSEDCIRSAFTITFLICCLLAAGFFAASSLVASFFGEEGLREGVAVSALNFFLVPFSITMSALFRREMAFEAIAVSSLSANFVMALTSVGLATLGFSFMGPVWGAVAGNLTMTVAFLAYRRNIGIFRPSARGWREVVSFGLYSSGTVIINVLYQWSPQLILGRVANLAAVGLYGRAVNITQIFDRLVLNVLDPVILPAIAAEARTGRQLKPTYLLAVELLAALHWPCLLVVALLADPIVRILFGSQWVDAVILVRMLALASLSLFAACLTYPVLVSTGRVRDTLTASLISVPPSLLVMVVASFFGIQAVAASAFLTLPLQAGTAFLFVCRRIDLGIADLAAALWKSAIVAATTMLGVALIVGINGFSLTFSNSAFVAAALLALVGWCLGLVMTRHPLLAKLMLALNSDRLIGRRLAEFRSLRSRARTAQP
ncbi:MAG: oligosaccharide flippase family protein [Rhodospirillales bacterium]|nr:oligosaccharide flippase family protein [Rhodospirillales bacterium]